MDNFEWNAGFGLQDAEAHAQDERIVFPGDGAAQRGGVKGSATFPVSQ
jgi:hypothetical protein